MGHLLCFSEVREISSFHTTNQCFVFVDGTMFHFVDTACTLRLYFELDACNKKNNDSQITNYLPVCDLLNRYHEMLEKLTLGPKS